MLGNEMCGPIRPHSSHQAFHLIWNSLQWLGHELVYRSRLVNLCARIPDNLTPLHDVTLNQRAERFGRTS